MDYLFDFGFVKTCGGFMLGFSVVVVDFNGGGLFFSWGVWTQGKKYRSCHLVIWSRNREYSVLSRKDLWSYCQSMGSEFRYALRKVLGTQDRPTLRLATHHCVLCPNLIKNVFNTCIYTHTHISIHLSVQHGILSQNNKLINLKQKSQTQKKP